jgi:hypothetical protein
MTYSPKQYEDLSHEEKTKISINALDWYKKHTDHVKKVMKENEKAYAPSGSDMFRPELWKSGHWNWFNTLITLW